MQVIIDFFNTLFLQPITNLLVLIWQALNAANIPGSFGVAIILLTIVIRLLIWPFMSAQLKSARKMAELKPHLDEIKKKHKDDRQAQMQAQAALFKEHGYNPAAGCLPALLQLPIIWALYQVLLSFFNGEELERVNTLLYSFVNQLSALPDLNFFGVNLATKPADFTNAGGALLLIPIITAVFTLLQSKMMTPQPIKAYPDDSAKELKEKEKTDDATSLIQSQMTYMMPLFVGFFAFQFPVGLALYWNTFTIVGIVQQYKIIGWGGLESWLRLIKR